MFLSLNGVTIPSDGYVLVSDIGISSSGLHCNTDRSDCCSFSDHPSGVAPQGHWYFPNGSEVMSFTIENAANPTRNFFSRDRRTRVVRLSRNRNPPDRGRFRCEIPNASGVIVTLYVNVGECTVFILINCHSMSLCSTLVDIIPSQTTTGPPMTTISQSTTTQTNSVTTTSTTAEDSNTAPPTSDAPATTALPPVSVDVAPINSSGTTIVGDIQILTCSVSVYGSSEQPTITWLDNNGAEISSSTTRMVSATSGSAGSYSITLTFNPLAASDAGRYTCRATLGSTMGSVIWVVNVQGKYM